MKKYISSFTKEVFNPSILFLQELPWSNPILLSKTLFGHFKRDSLYRNSIFLMLSTFIMSFFGFFFWTINARLYTTEQIGIATSLISLTTLLSSISILGLNTGIIRFLPKTKKVNGLLTAIFIIIITFSFVITTIYLGLIDKFSPKLSFLLDNMPLLLFFILVVVLTALNIFKDSIFIAFKNAHYSVTYNFVYSITRLASPVLLVSFGFIGIFIAHTIGIVSALLISFFYLVNKFSYTVSLQIEKNLLRNTVLFSLGSFSANLIGGLPSSLFPLIVLNKLGPTYSAYYYIDMMIISFLYMIPISISQSLFAESSSQESSIKKFIFKSFRLNSLVLIPAIIVTMVLGEYVLLVFGEDYARGGLNFLRIMALSTLFIPVNYTFGVFLRIRNKIKLINFTITIGTITTISVAYLFVPLFGLYGMAAALISGQLVQAIFYSIYIFVIRRFS